MKIVKAIIAIAVVGVAAYFVSHLLQVRQTADLNNRAMKLLGENKFAEARDLLEQARRRDSNNPVIWKNLGVAYEGLKDVPKAIEAYQRSLTLHSAQPEVRDNLAILKKAVEIEKQSAAKLEAELTNKPNDAQVLARVGMAYENLGDNARAIEMYERSLKADPNQPDVRQRLEALKKK